MDLVRQYREKVENSRKQQVAELEKLISILLQEGNSEALVDICQEYRNVLWKSSGFSTLLRIWDICMNTGDIQKVKEYLMDCPFSRILYGNGAISAIDLPDKTYRNVNGITKDLFDMINIFALDIKMRVAEYKAVFSQVRRLNIMQIPTDCLLSYFASIVYAYKLKLDDICVNVIESTKQTYKNEFRSSVLSYLDKLASMDVEKLIPLFGKAVEKMEGWEEILQRSKIYKELDLEQFKGYNQVNTPFELNGKQFITIDYEYYNELIKEYDDEMQLIMNGFEFGQDNDDDDQSIM